MAWERTKHWLAAHPAATLTPLMLIAALAYLCLLCTMLAVALEGTSRVGAAVSLLVAMPVTGVLLAWSRWLGLLRRRSGDASGTLLRSGATLGCWIVTLLMLVPILAFGCLCTIVAEGKGGPEEGRYAVLGMAVSGLMVAGVAAVALLVVKAGAALANRNAFGRARVLGEGGSAVALPRMYDEFARYWPLISPPEDYADEAARWRDALRRRLGPGRHRILELGVGGGNNLSHLTGDFDAVAVDLAPAMIEQARRLNPGVELHVGDMRSVRLGRTFRAVLIHDAIGYMLTEDDLRATLATAAAHLEPGGVLVMSPDWFRETFRDPHVNWGTNSDGEVTFTLIDYTYDPDPSDTTIESLCWYLIREGGQLRVEQDRHVLGLFSLDTWLRLMDKAGFEAETDPYDVHEDGRPSWLLIGTLRRWHRVEP